MSWATPDTFATGDAPTAAQMNKMRDNFLALRHPAFTQLNPKDITNTITETSLFSGTTGVTVPGNSMGANGVIFVDLRGDYLRNTAGDTIFFKIRHAGVILFQGAAYNLGSAAASTLRHPWQISFAIENLAATAVQSMTGTSLFESAGVTPPTVGIGTMTNTALVGEFGGSGTADTTVDQVVDVTATWSAASVNDSWRVRSARVYIEQA